MRNFFSFGGKDSRDYGVYLSGAGTYNSPAREYQNISIPGRDGDLLSTSTRLQNVELTYRCGIVSDAEENLAALRSMLLSTVGYVRLTDSYHPEEYRLAVYKGGLEVEMEPHLQAGEFDLTFECKPQRWLTSGETPVSVANGDTLTNPTPMPARLLIRVSGYGELTVGDVMVTVAENNYTHIDIDCEMMDCFSGDANCNSLVSFSGNDFPVLPAGETGIAYDSTITSCQITPRWWRV